MDAGRALLLMPKQIHPDLGNHIPWGQIVVNNGLSVLKATLVSVEVESERHFGENYQKFCEAFKIWKLRLYDSISLLSLTDIRIPDFENVIDASKDRLYMVKNGVIAKLKQCEPLTISFQLPYCFENGVPAPAVTTKIIEQSIEIASSGRTIRLELNFLLDSQTALSIGNYRKSVLDTSTALELALTNTIKKNLNVDEKIRNIILKDHNTLAKKRQLLGALDISLPNFDYQHKVDDIRNKAIHIGRLPSEAEAREAFRIVKETIDIIIQDKLEPTEQ